MAPVVQMSMDPVRLAANVDMELGVFMAKSTRTPMTDDHKAALAAGRAEGRAVKRYLEGLESSRPRRGRRRTPASIAARLEKIDREFVDADPVQRLNLVQERIDLNAELASMEDPVDLASLEGEFVAAAKGYSDRKGISYAAWREVGVPPAVLKRHRDHPGAPEPDQRRRARALGSVRRDPGAGCVEQGAQQDHAVVAAEQQDHWPAQGAA